MDHRWIEERGLAMAVLTTVVVSIGGLCEIVPLFTIKDTVPNLEGVKPYPPWRWKAGTFSSGKAA